MWIKQSCKSLQNISCCCFPQSFIILQMLICHSKGLTYFILYGSISSPADATKSDVTGICFPLEDAERSTPYGPRISVFLELCPNLLSFISRAFRPVSSIAVTELSIASCFGSIVPSGLSAYSFVVVWAGVVVPSKVDTELSRCWNYHSFTPVCADYVTQLRHSSRERERETGEWLRLARLATAAL